MRLSVATAVVVVVLVSAGALGSADACGCSCGFPWSGTGGTRLICNECCLSDGQSVTIVSNVRALSPHLYTLNKPCPRCQSAHTMRADAAALLDPLQFKSQYGFNLTVCDKGEGGADVSIMMNGAQIFQGTRM